MRWRCVSAALRAAGILLLAACSYAAAAGRVKLQDGRLMLGERPFLVRGVVYSNVAIGERAGPTMAASPCRFARDLPLVAALGANTIRTQALLPEADTAFTSLLESTGLYWLAGFPLEPFYDPAQTITARKAQILEAFANYARRFRGQKRLIGYVLGNEVSRDYAGKFAGSPVDFYALVEEAAALLRQLEPEDTPLLTTAVSDPAELAQAPPGISFWCWNACPGLSFGGLLAEARRRAAKPVLISEFGVDAFDERTRQEDEQAQAEAAATLAREIESAGWLLGGIYRSYVDEWWRGGPDAARHAAGGAPHPGFPDGFRNDGWFGIFRVVATAQPGLDSLHPRAVAGVLTGLWGGSGINVPAGTETPRLVRIENAASGLEMASPGALVRLVGERFATATTADQSWPLHLGRACLCFSAAPARLGMLAPGELSAQVPPLLNPEVTAVTLYREGAASNVLPVPLQRYAPGIFPHGVVWAGSRCAAGPANAVRAGDWLEVYATGLGAEPAATGVVEADFYGLNARVLYTGLLEDAVGVHQVNIQVPPDLPVARGSGLWLLAGGVRSNLYRLDVAGPDERVAVALRASQPEVVVQAGGEPRTVSVEVEGVNGFCGAVFFQAPGRPAGITFEIPVAFPGQAVPLVVRAARGTPALHHQDFVLTGYSGGASGSLTLRLTVLPDQGDIPVRVVSGGFQAGSLARFDWNHRTLYSTTGGGPGRGLNVMSVHPASGVFSPVRSFDTWRDEQASAALVAYLASLPEGTIVLMAVADEASYRLSEAARAAIASWFGSQHIQTLGYQHSWALIGRKGGLKPAGEGTAADRQVLLERVLTLPQP